MKIIQTPARYYPYIGGVESYVRDIAKALVKNGHHVEVMCADEPHADMTNDHGVTVTRLPYLFKVANTNITLSLPLRLLISRFDVMHTHLPTPWSADWSTVIAKIKGKPVVLAYQNDITGHGIGGMLAKIYNVTMLRLILRLADKILISHQQYMTHSPFLQRYKEKVLALPLCVDTDVFKKTDTQQNTHEVFFLSLLSPYHRYKGLDVLLEAMREVMKAVPDVLLTVGGAGELLPQYRERSVRLGLVDNVTFAGRIPQSDLPTYYSRAAVFVLPSLSAKQEGFGLVNVEALACGTPVITTSIVGIADEVRRYRCGLVVEPNSIKQLADGIIDVLTNQKRREMFARNGAQLVEQHTLARHVLRLEEIYHEVQQHAH